MLQGHVSSKDAHEMMMLMVMPCHDHAQMMLKCKANTWGVTALPPYKNLIPRFGKCTIFYKRRGKLLANNLPVPTLHLSHYGYSTWSCIISPLDFVSLDPCNLKHILALLHKSMFSWSWYPWLWLPLHALEDISSVMRHETPEIPYAFLEVPKVYRRSYHISQL
jgi:hypothetical protein